MARMTRIKGAERKGLLSRSSDVKEICFPGVAGRSELHSSRVIGVMGMNNGQSVERKTPAGSITLNGAVSRRHQLFPRELNVAASCPGVQFDLTITARQVKALPVSIVKGSI